MQTRRPRWGLILGVVAVTGLALAQGNGGPPARGDVEKRMREGNWNEAYKGFSALALFPDSDPKQVGNDLTKAVQCLRNLGRTNESDAFREKVIAVHAKNWRLLTAAARSFMQDEHYGSIVAGEFVRGPHRGGTAKWANCYERDRVRALQLMDQGLKALETFPPTDSGEAAGFYYDFSTMLLGDRGGSEAWRLQYLTDLTKLPDFEDGWYQGSGRRGAPVNADGSPILHRLPKSWADATTDGERWRWSLAHGPYQCRWDFADFLCNQFGVQTMAEYGWFFGRMRSDDDTRKDESGTWDLHTLTETETIAKLATGIKRFPLPDEFNYIKLFQQIAAEKTDAMGRDAFRRLGQIFEDRRQYDQAASYWGKAKEPDRVQQIVGNWGMFEPILTQPAGGKGASVEFRFRNGKEVQLEAVEINVRKLLDDVKAYIATLPKQLNWEQLDIGNIGYRLVEKNQTQYLGMKAAEWTLPLTPRPAHWDKRITVQTPLKKAGAYLLTAKMQNGNISRIIVWIADTAIVKKFLDKGTYYFVADAVSGKPLAGLNLDFFGYRQNWVNKGNAGSYEITLKQYAGTTDPDGQYVRQGNDEERNFSWLLTATSPDGRLTYLGFAGVWWGNYHDQEYNQSKSFFITDRPVYRPEQTVKFKAWMNNAKYDLEGKSPYAGQTVTIVIHNPKSEKVLEKSYTADVYGGIGGELALPKGAALGVYSLSIQGPPHGGSSFRVEEYKKPEFEVTVEAPKEPVMLGEKITATIKAKYYFGAPVTDAKVKYKILRSESSAQWFPMARWDWYYGPGYWWFACDYPWYPGWREWGCWRPVPWWWGHAQQPPELVAEADVKVDKDGTVKVQIDTALVKVMHGDTDHRYDITAEVTDQSRRTIVGTGSVLVARKPFKVYAWVDRGHYRTGEVVHAAFKAQTLDNQPVKGKGDLKLFRISYDRDGQPTEKRVERWKLDTDDQGSAELQMKAAEPGQYRFSYQVTDSKGHGIEGGYVFCVMGEGMDADSFRFNDIELVPDAKEYAPGGKVKLAINTNRKNSTVLLFLRPSNGVYQLPKVLRLSGRSVQETVEIVKKDMPNVFIEAVTVSGGQLFSETREIVVPPEKRVYNVTVTPTKDRYLPGEKAQMKLQVTDVSGEPVPGTAVVSIYDKSVEYVSGGSNVPEIKSFFWKWRRSHNPRQETSLDKSGYNIIRSGERGMNFLGAFGASLADESGLAPGGVGGGSGGGGKLGQNRQQLRGAMNFQRKGGMPMPTAAAAPMMEAAKAERQMANGAMAMDAMSMDKDSQPGDRNREMEQAAGSGSAIGGPGSDVLQATVRSQFADTALWIATLPVDQKGQAPIELTMPENLTTWKAKVWVMGDGTRVGEGAVEVVTAKNVIVRLQAPRFFVQKDEVVLSANIHNFLKHAKNVSAALEIEGVDGAQLEPVTGKAKIVKPGVWSVGQQVQVAAAGEQRVDWRIRVLQPGTVKVRMKALTDEESDAMEMSFPVYVHGMLKMDSFCGVLRPDKDSASITVTVPAERRPEQTRLELRYSPTLAMAMVDALPYMVDYPYGCTEQTLNRFLPTVITQRILQRMGVNLADIQKKRTNLNAQEIGDDVKRAADWKRANPPNPDSAERNPVFDEAKVQDMVKAGIERLQSMQCGDGGWGWFSGYGEHSWPHTTAHVVHGLQIARENDVQVQKEMIARGVEWLKRYQAAELQKIKNAPSKTQPWKQYADDLDAYVYLVLVDEKTDNKEMREFLYRDRNYLAVYTKAMFGMACHRVGDMEKRDMLVRNVDQYLKQDDENQTAYLQLPENNCWWYWYGSEYEAHAYYLKLLAIVEPKGEKASRLVKYLLNNRRHATYWNSTRDTAVVIEAFADFLKASGEEQPDIELTVLVDGKESKKVKVNKENLFTFDNRLVQEGVAVTAGKHVIELRRTGKGPVYFNAYLTNFTLEDPITKAGLEIKVNRSFFKLERVAKTVKVEGVRGQALDQKVEKYERRPLKDLDMLKSGDLVEVELVIDSKNDYEYIFFEDMKGAGFEPVEVRSGYTGNEMGAYVEFRDERVVFFVRALARGKHSVSYRVRAEIPGRFSALPAKASAMYAPELKANSDEMKLQIED